MLKSLVKKVVQTQNAGGAGELQGATDAAGEEQLNKSVRLNQVSDMAVNEQLNQQDLIDEEEEKQREDKFKIDHVEYLRIARKPLQFGIEEDQCYTQHQHMQIQGVIQNFNNK